MIAIERDVRGAQVDQDDLPPPPSDLSALTLEVLHHLLKVSQEAIEGDKHLLALIHGGWGKMLPALDKTTDAGDVALQHHARALKGDIIVCTYKRIGGGSRRFFTL